MGAASCFGSSSTVVIWVPLLFTQAYTVQASIWWRRRWISNTKMQKLFNSATCLDFSFHQDFSSFLLNRLYTARKIPQLWDKYIYQRYTLPYHISLLYFQKKEYTQPSDTYRYSLLNYHQQCVSEFVCIL